MLVVRTFFLVLTLSEQCFLFLLEKPVVSFLSVTLLHFAQMKLAKFSVYVGK